MDTMIKRLREERGWSQGQLARAAGVDQGWLSRIERRIDGCPLRQVMKIAEALEVEYSLLVDDLMAQG